MRSYVHSYVCAFVYSYVRTVPADGGLKFEKQKNRPVVGNSHFFCFFRSAFLVCVLFVDFTQWI